MAKQIIILERLNEPSDMCFRYAFWLTVPAGREVAYADAAKTSAFKNASTPELDAIKAGQIVEVVDTFAYSIGTPLATVQADLIARYNVAQAALAARNPTRRYGTFWDGTSWTAGGTA